MKTRRGVAKPFLALLLAMPVWCGAEAPSIDPADDSSHFGPPERLLFWNSAQKVAGFRNMTRILPTRRIAAAAKPRPFPVAEVDLDELEFDAGGGVLTTREYMKRKNVAGLLVLKDGTIRYERYALGNAKDTPWVSFSVAKSVVSMLIGAAIQDGYIESVDERVTDYLPRLKGSSYEQSTIRNLLQMASGVEWNEDYDDPTSDVSTANWETLALYEFLGSKLNAAPPGQRFNYNTAETNLAGTLLRSAIGNNLATYLSERIWIPMGMEFDASWNLTEPGGGEFGGCCINATLRDYARLGVFAMNDGRLPDGTRVLPEGWMQESTSPSKAFPGYGYFWWLEREGVFRASGIFGQAIYIDTQRKVVIAQHSARDAAFTTEDMILQLSLFRALSRAVATN
ncbi:MAG: serine hydrolase [Pseudomonadota bacterium]